MLSDTLLTEIDVSWWRRAAHDADARLIILSGAVARAYREVTARTHTLAIHAELTGGFVTDVNLLQRAAPTALPARPRCGVVETTPNDGGDVERRQCVGTAGHEGDHCFDFRRPMGVPQ